MKSHSGSRSGSIKEVDLHLKAGYNSSDAIDRQIELFRSELDSAMRSGRKEIIFIHGVGSGRLKQELINTLTKYYPSFSYHDAPFNKYGYGGAMLVRILRP